MRDNEEMMKRHGHRLNRPSEAKAWCAVLCVAGLGLMPNGSSASPLRQDASGNVMNGRKTSMRSLGGGNAKSSYLTRDGMNGQVRRQLPSADNTSSMRSQTVDGKKNTESRGLSGVRQSTVSKLLTETLSNKMNFAHHNIQRQNTKGQGNGSQAASRFIHLNTTRRTVATGSTLSSGLAGTQHTPATRNSVLQQTGMVKNTRASIAPKAGKEKQESSVAKNKFGFKPAGDKGIKRSSLRPSSTLLKRQDPSDGAISRTGGVAPTTARPTSVAPGGVKGTKYDIGKTESVSNYKERPKTDFGGNMPKTMRYIEGSFGPTGVATKEQTRRPFSAALAPSETRGPTSRELNSNRTIEVPNMQFDAEKHYTHNKTTTQVSPHRFFRKSDNEKGNNRDNDRVQPLELSNYLHTPGSRDRQVMAPRVTREKNKRSYIDSPQRHIAHKERHMVLDDALSTPVNSPIAEGKSAQSGFDTHEVPSVEEENTAVISNRENRTAEICLWSDTSDADADCMTLIRNATANERTELVEVSRALGSNWKKILEVLRTGANKLREHDKKIEQSRREMEEMKEREDQRKREIDELHQEVKAMQRQNEVTVQAIRNAYHFKPTEDPTSCYITDNERLIFQGTLSNSSDQTVVPQGPGTLTFDVGGKKVNVSCVMYGGCLSVHDNIQVKVDGMTLNISGDPNGKACDLIYYNDQISDLNSVKIDSDSQVTINCNAFKVLFKNDYMFIGNTNGVFSDEPKDGFLLTNGHACIVENGQQVYAETDPSSSETSSMYEVD